MSYTLAPFFLLENKNLQSVQQAIILTRFIGTNNRMQGHLVVPPDNLILRCLLTSFILIFSVCCLEVCWRVYLQVFVMELLKIIFKEVSFNVIICGNEVILSHCGD